MINRRTALAMMASSAAGLVAGKASAQSGMDFFDGKTVNYIVATSAGGGFDLYGRLFAKYMQRYLPGSTFVVRNVAGAGHLIGANAIYSAEPDGLTIGTFSTGVMYNQLIGLEGVRFDMGRMSWIGKASSDPRVLTISADSPIETYEDLFRSDRPIKFATSGMGSAAYVETLMLTNTLNIPAQVVTGYEGQNDHLAIMRGEVDASISSRSSWQRFVDDGHGRFLVQIGGHDPDVPQLSDLVEDPVSRALVALVQSQGEISRLTAGPPNIPEDRLQALREAYRLSIDDPEMQEEVAALERPLEAAVGEDVAAMVRAALDQSPETISMLRDALGVSG